MIRFKALRPWVSQTLAPIIIATPGMCALGAVSLGSITAVTFIPLETSSTAVCHPLSLFVNTAILVPAATPYLVAYALTDPASIIPGRSLFGNAIERSVAPPQIIARFE